MTMDTQADAGAEKSTPRVMKKCPKCGKLNEADAIFCEDCDWKLNTKYAGGGDANHLLRAWQIAVVSFLLGIGAAVCSFVTIPLIGVILGAFGMFLGGYVQSLARVLEISGSNRKYIVALGICGLLLSVVGFMFGFAHLF